MELIASELIGLALPGLALIGLVLTGLALIVLRWYGDMVTPDDRTGSTDRFRKVEQRGVMREENETR